LLYSNFFEDDGTERLWFEDLGVWIVELHDHIDRMASKTLAR
jgi:hypothetical protein